MKKLKKFNENWIDDETNDTKARNAALDNLEATPSGRDAEPFSDEDYDKIFDEEEPIEDLAKRYEEESKLDGTEENTIADLESQLDAAFKNKNIEALTKSLQEIKVAHPELNNRNSIWWDALKKWHKILTGK